MTDRRVQQLRAEARAALRDELRTDDELEQLYAELVVDGPAGASRWSDAGCVYCGAAGNRLVGRGVTVCPSHRDLVRCDPAYVLRSDHGVARATRPEARPAPSAAIARDARVGGAAPDPRAAGAP